VTKVIKLKLVPAPNEANTCEGCYSWENNKDCTKIIAMAKEQGRGSCLVGRQEEECIYIEDKENIITETEKPNNTLHKHHKEIIAWANGAIIEMRLRDNEQSWVVTCNPSWHLDNEYRVLVEEKDNIVCYTTAEVCPIRNSCIAVFTIDKSNKNNLKLTFDGETEKLISAEVI
jgi:hypothetical protein